MNNFFCSPQLCESLCLITTLVSRAVGNAGKESKFRNLENLSMMTKMTVFLTDSGKLVSARCDQGCNGFSSGSYLPAGRCLGTLACAQVEQEAIILFISTF